MKASEVVFKTEVTVDEEIKDLKSKVKNLEKTKSQINKENAEAYKLRTEAKILEKEVEVKRLQTLNTSILFVSETLSGFTFSEMKDKTAFKDMLNKAKVEAKLVELIERL